jgi:LysM domain
MPGDAKLGLVVGVALVILAGVLLRREGSLVTPAAPRSAVTAPPAVLLAAEPNPETIPPPVPPWRLHRVEEGETLFSLAYRYYGDGSRSWFLFRANRQQLMAPDRLPPGTVLRVPTFDSVFPEGAPEGESK